MSDKPKIKRKKFVRQLDDFTFGCVHRNHGEPAMLADQGIFNLGFVTLWLCTNCTARVREHVLSGMLESAAAKQFHVDGELQQMLKDKVKLDLEHRDRLEGAA